MTSDNLTCKVCKHVSDENTYLRGSLKKAGRGICIENSQKNASKTKTDLRGPFRMYVTEDGLNNRKIRSDANIDLRVPSRKYATEDNLKIRKKKKKR